MKKKGRTVDESERDGNGRVSVSELKNCKGKEDDHHRQRAYGEPQRREEREKENRLLSLLKKTAVRGAAVP